MALNPDWKDFLELLNQNEVEYLIVGAFALAHHGIPRLTGDIDFWCRPSRSNATALLSALQAFGMGGLNITVEDLTKEDGVIQIGYPPRRIDLLTAINAVEFQGAWERRTSGLLDGVPTQFISVEDLRTNKRAVGRPKDLADLASIDAITKP
ncbi:MAG: DUF6036 family nucleotidyltransferase [Fimbriimonas sp.]